MSNDSNPYAAESDAASNPYAPTAHVGDANVDVTDVEAYRKHYLNHEASCKSIGVLYLLGAIFLVPMGLFVIAAAANSGVEGNENPVIVGVIGGFYLLLGVIQGVVGFGLRKLRPWARIGGSVLSVIGLIGFPIGTLVSGYFLYCLLGKKGQVVFSEDYRRVIDQTPDIKYKTSIIVWILLGLVVALIALGVVAAVVGG